MTTLPSASTMYQALVDRDSEFEGVFYVGVTTTGIFCRPTCPARKPKPENVEFFGSPKEALYAGYRPCLRCQPLDRDKKAPELVTRLRALDRVLRFGHYVVPHWYGGVHRVAYRDGRFEQPAVTPRYYQPESWITSTWWASKANRDELRRGAAGQTKD